MNADIPQGYKQTEVGVIPEDWEVKRLGDLADVSTGGTPSRDIPLYWNGTIPWVTTSQVDFNTILESEQFITEDGLSNSAAKLLPAGTLLIALYGQGKTRGKVAVLGIATTTNQACASISPHTAILPDFLLRFLASRYEVIRNLSNTGSQDNLNGEIVKSIFVILPPKEEQRAIADALSDVDALLAKLDALIAKKRDIKQAAMQRLLTGQARLPGFSAAWEAKKLSSVGTFAKGSGVRKDQSFSGALPCIRYGEIYTRHNDYIKEFYSWISPEVATTATRLKKGDLLFAGSGETKEEIGKCVAFLDDVEAYAGGDIVILRPDNASAMFLGYYLNTAPISTQKASRGQGDAVVHISGHALSSIDVTIPEVPEQTAIATILSDMDAEITALEARRDKTHALKQGMMQELLTGRIRLV